MDFDLEGEEAVGDEQPKPAATHPIHGIVHARIPSFSPKNAAVSDTVKQFQEILAHSPSEETIYLELKNLFKDGSLSFVLEGTLIAPDDETFSQAGKLLKGLVDRHGAQALFHPKKGLNFSFNVAEKQPPQKPRPISCIQNPTIYGAGHVGLNTARGSDGLIEPLL
ncbi:MAG: hypothetical protein V1746_07730 [bacterium]